MGRLIDFLGTYLAYAKSLFSQSDISSATILAVKIRVRGDVLTQIVQSDSGYGPELIRIGSTETGKNKFMLIIQDTGLPNINFRVEVNNAGGSGQVTVARSNFTESDFYIIYAHRIADSATSALVEVYASDGTLIASGSGWGDALPAGGYVSSGRANDAIYTNDGGIDGIAIYSAALTGVNRYSVPTAGDANILAFWPFDEASGSSIANAVAGGVALELQGAENTDWARVSGGTWDGAPALSAALTGTLADGATEAQIVSGGETLIITVANDGFLSLGTAFDAIRQNIIDGIVSAQNEAAGFNALRSTIPVTAVVRTSTQVATVTLPALAGYAVSANEVWTVTVPAAALQLGVAVVATPTVTITNATPAGPRRMANMGFGAVNPTFPA